MENKHLIRIAIISIYPFPIGLAPTNRIIAYSKGLIQNGAIIDVYLPFPTDTHISESSNNSQGIYQGIRYCYTSGRYKSKAKLFRAIATFSYFRKIYGYLSSVLKIYSDNKSFNFNCIIISTDHILSLFVYTLFAKFIGVHSIFIFDEYPIPIRHKLKSKIPLLKMYLFKMVLKNTTAYVSITEELKNYYNSFSLKKTFVLPIIIDIAKFDTELVVNNQPMSKKYICYMGNFELNKDDVDNIINAFELVSRHYPLIDLHLYGAPSKKNYEYILSLIKKLNLNDRVVLKGKVSTNFVPQILGNAILLVSSQPKTKRASGGFPTKLGEYILSGVPTLITDVGENAKYVRDGIDVFLTEPGNFRSYAQKIIYILENYTFALNVANNGKQLLINNYSHIIMGKKLLDFIRTL